MESRGASPAGDRRLLKRGGFSRRKFLGGAITMAPWTIVPRSVLGGRGQVAPSEKITLAGIGTGGQGIQNLAIFAQFPEIQITAVCDPEREREGYLSWNWAQGKETRTAGREPARRMVQEHYAAQKQAGQWKGCAAYADYRELLEKEDVDAVMIATPDHTHAVITMAALKKGKHVYCEKPLTWSVYEARQVTELARKMKVATQLGNQGQASEEARLVQEFILDGAIGPVQEVHIWSGPRFWTYPSWAGRPQETPPVVPEGLDWDLWLGPAPYRPYHPCYHPWTWRNWWDFGTGLIGDLWCHKVSTVFKALKLTYPTSVEASATQWDRDHPELYPLGIIARYEFPARGDMPPLVLYWYDGGLKPPRPKELEPGRPMGDVIYIGEKGALMNHRIIPEEKMKAYGRPPRKLPRSPGHHKEWIDAIRGGPPAGSNFVDHGGLLTEAGLLANVALRADRKLSWNGPELRCTNDDSANQFLHRPYRDGWSL